MKTSRFRNLRQILLLALLLPAISRVAYSATIVWTNTLGGNWSVAANWSPNQVPGAGDTANITSAGTYAVTLDVNSSVLNLTVGGAVSGVQTLQGSFTLAATNAIVNGGGILGLSNSSFSGALTIASGGIFNGSGETLNAQLTVQSGGELLANGNTTFGGNANSSNQWLWVQSGGLMNASSGAPIYLYVQMTNAGTLNLTNYGFSSIYNPGTSPNYDGGLVNQSGGIVNLIGTAGISGSGGFDSMLNQGTINVTNGSSTINLDNMLNQGTVATLPGTGSLTIGTFNGLGTLAGTYNAAAGTTIKFVSNNNPGTSAGAGLILGGSGQYQFTAGLLTLTTNVIPNLALDGGTLSLGAGFQGGAITNLTLGGINLTNTLPITGALVMTNGNLYGTIIVANNAVLETSSATVDAQVTVESGAEFLAVGSTTLGGNANSTNEWLWVQSGGLMNAASGAPVTLYVQMTNAGTLNFTNYGINSMYNPGGSPNYDGGLVNQATGIINLTGTAAISGSGGFDSLLNQGTINISNGGSTISLDNIINQGTVATLTGSSLTIGTFNGLGTLTGTYNAAAGTVIRFVSNNNPGTSAGAGLALGGSGQYQFTSGLLTLTNSLIPNLALSGGTLLLGPEFQGGAITNLTLDGINLTNTLPVTGTLIVTNGTLYGTIIVSNNAVLETSGVTIDMQMTVENGGEFLAIGNTTFGGNANSTNEWVWVQSGGLMSASSAAPITLYVQMTNAGTVNFTNYGINSMYNPGTSPNYDGGLVNQAGGIVNLIGTAGISGSGGFDFVLNQGTINVTNGNSTISVDNMFNQGTVATLPGTGTLTIGNFNGLGTLTGTYNAAAGTVIKFVSNNNPGTSVGAGLTLLGSSGQYQFGVGLLTLTTNVIPNLALDGGILSLAPGFQGGAVTNLTTSSMILTNSLPITGALVMTNGTLTTTNTLNNGAVLSLYNTTLNGSIVVTNHGVLLTSAGASLDAQVTVENGGEFLANGNTVLGGNSNSTNEWLWMQSGGLMNAASGAPITVYVQVTNAGTLNFTNYGINSMFNPGNTPNFDGGLINQAGGVINLIETAGISGTGGFDFLLNQGTINILNGNSSISVNNFTNIGTLNAELWTLQLQSTNINLQAAGSLDMALAGPATFGNFDIRGRVALTGGLVVTLTNGYIPVVESAFIVLTNGPVSGGFTSFSLPHVQDAAWQPVYSTNALDLMVQPLIALLPSGTNVVVNLNGTPGHQAIELTATNVTVPLTNWTPVITNTFDVTTYLGVTNNINPTRPRQFFTFQLK